VITFLGNLTHRFFSYPQPASLTIAVLHCQGFRIAVRAPCIVALNIGSSPSFKARRSCHVSFQLQQLMFLPIDEHIDANIIKLTFKALHAVDLSNLAVLFRDCAPARA